MSEYTDQNDRPGGTGPGADHAPDIATGARRELEAAETGTDGERLEVLDRLYKDLEGALES